LLVCDHLQHLIVILISSTINYSITHFRTSQQNSSHEQTSTQRTSSSSGHDMTWHICSPQLDMDFFLCRQLYHYKRNQYQSLDCWTWWIWQEAVHCDGSGMNNCFLPETHHIQHSTAQLQLLIWNSSSQSLVMQNVKNVRRRIDKRRKVNLKLLCNNRTEVCLKNSMKTVGSGTDWSPQQQTQI
jgi:hypothetical protein